MSDIRDTESTCAPDPDCRKCKGTGWREQANADGGTDATPCRCTEMIQECPACDEPIRQTDDIWIENNGGGEVWHFDCHHQADREADVIRHSDDDDYHRARGDA